MSSPALAIQLSEAEMRLLQALVYQECGMYFDARRTHFLQDRLQRRLRECRIDSFYNYYRLLISAEGREELARLLENLTVNETSFFRNKAQLELFHKGILENAIREKQAAGNHYLRIWSAGCSTGQEAYTIAMLVADALADAVTRAIDRWLAYGVAPNNAVDSIYGTVTVARNGEQRATLADSLLTFSSYLVRARAANIRWPRSITAIASATSTKSASGMPSRRASRKLFISTFTI